VRVFISHAHDDKRLAAELVALLEAALHLPDNDFMCTTVDGSSLPGGARVDEHLRRDVRDADVLIGVVSVRSVQSSYVLFELGARWGADTYMMPVLAPGERMAILPGPLPGRHALRLDNARQIDQCVREIAEHLDVKPDIGPKYVSHRTRIMQIRSRSRDAVSRNAHAAVRLRAENEALREQIERLEEASWRSHPTLESLTVESRFNDEGSGEEVRRWVNLRATETHINLSIPYAFVVARPKGRAASPRVAELLNPKSDLPARFRPEKTGPRKPHRADGHIEIPGRLTKDTRFVGFEIRQGFERAFCMTRDELAVAYADDKWKTEYVAAEVIAPTDILEISVTLPWREGVSAEPIVFVGHDETTQDPETDRIRDSFTFDGTVAVLRVEKPLRGLHYAVSWMPPS